MGLGEDVLVLMEILPVGNSINKIPFNEEIHKETILDENKLINKIKMLEEKDGQYIWINDFHRGILAGKLKYIPLFQDTYFLENCSKSGKSEMLKIHDLSHIF